MISTSMGEPVDASAEAEAFAPSNLFRRADIHWLTCEGALMGMWKSAHGRIAVKEQHRRVQRPFLSTRRVLQTRERGWGSGGGLRLGLAAGLCSHGGCISIRPEHGSAVEAHERALRAAVECLLRAAHRGSDRDVSSSSAASSSAPRFCADLGRQAGRSDERRTDEAGLRQGGVGVPIGPNAGGLEWRRPRRHFLGDGPTKVARRLSWRA